MAAPVDSVPSARDAANAASDGKTARTDEAKTARLRGDLRDCKGRFRVEWFRALDGVGQTAPTIDGGEERELTAPWKGQDVVLRLLLTR
jgi:hypothetical protein